MDWSKSKVIKKSNSIISSIRTEVEEPKVTKAKAKIITKKQDESFVLYPKVWQWCDKCAETTVNFLKENNVNCMYCGHYYKITPRAGATVANYATVQDYNKFLFL